MTDQRRRALSCLTANRWMLCKFVLRRGVEGEGEGEDQVVNDFGDCRRITCDDIFVAIVGGFGRWWGGIEEEMSNIDIDIYILKSD